MSLCIALATPTVLLPAAAMAGPEHTRLLAAAQAHPMQAACLHDAFCVGNANTVPKWICDQFKAAERPVLKPQVSGLALK